MKILLVNQGHTDNLGDKAISKIMTYYLTEVFNNTVISAPFIAYEKTSEITENRIFANDKKNSNDFKYRKITWKQKFNRICAKLLPESIVYIIKEKKAISKFLDNYKQIDAVIIGGGELIKNHHPFTYAFLMWINCVKKKYKCPIAIWGVSSDEKFSFGGKVIYRYAIKNSSYIGVRDLKTKEIIKNLYKVDAEYSPDIVFEYNHIFEQKIEPSRDVLFFLNSYEEVKLAYSTETNYFSQFVKNIPPTHKLLRVGFVTQDDYFEAIRFCEYLVNKLKYDKNIVVLEKTFSVSELVNVIAQCGTVISGRMHPMILGLQFGKKIIPIPVKKKLEIFEEEWKEVEIGTEIYSIIESHFEKMINVLDKSCR